MAEIGRTYLSNHSWSAVTFQLILRQYSNKEWTLHYPNTQCYELPRWNNYCSWTCTLILTLWLVDWQVLLSSLARGNYAALQSWFWRRRVQKRFHHDSPWRRPPEGLLATISSQICLTIMVSIVPLHPWKIPETAHSAFQSTFIGFQPSSEERLPDMINQQPS